MPKNTRDNLEAQLALTRRLVDQYLDRLTLQTLSEVIDEIEAKIAALPARQ